MHDFARASMEADRVGQGLKQRGHAPDPLGHGRAVEINPGTRVNLALPVQGQMVAIFRDQHMRQQARSGTPALDRQRRHRQLRHRLAIAARELRSRMHDDFEV